MTATAEVRWFFEQSAPPALAVWFHSAQRHGCSAGGGRTSVDAYLLEPGNAQLGIKRRSGKAGLEIKVLAGALERGCEQAPFEGRIELWVKQTATQLGTHGHRLVEVSKRRWVRLFDCSDDEAVRELSLAADGQPTDQVPTPARRCRVELTELELMPGGRWMTLAFEAHGPVESVAESLRRTAQTLALRAPPGLDGPLEASYPGWLPRAIP